MDEEYENIAIEIYDLFVLCQFGDLKFEEFRKNFQEEIKKDYPWFKKLCDNRQAVGNYRKNKLPMNYANLEEFIAYWRPFILLSALESIEETQAEEPENLHCFYDELIFDEDQDEFIVLKCLSFEQMEKPYHLKDSIVALSEYDIDDKHSYAGDFVFGRVVNVKFEHNHGEECLVIILDMEEHDYSFVQTPDSLFMNVVTSMYLPTVYARNFKRLKRNPELLEYFLDPDVSGYYHEIDRNYRTDNNDLNASQDLAVQTVLKCLEENWRIDIPMILGPPGTGKTHTIIAILENVFKKDPKARVLVCAPSNAAANAIARRVVDDELIFRKKKSFLGAGPIFRLGAIEKIDEELLRFRPQHSGEAKRMFESPCLIFSTLSSCQPFLLRDYIEDLTFDLVIIDEASQSSEIETLMPVVYDCRTTVLVGDPKQLKPTVRSRLCQNVGYSRSFFERYQQLKNWAEEDSTVRLRTQYRMKRPICKFSSDHFYYGELETAPRSGVNDDINLHPVTCYDLPHSREMVEEKSYVNVVEAKFILEKLSDVLWNKIEHDYCPTVGIICFYKAQVELIEEMLEDADLPEPRDIKVNTVDSFQGQEKDIIFISCCRGNTQQMIGFASLSNRLNVAITRAKTACIMVVNRATFSNNTLWCKLFDYYSRRSRLLTED